MSGSGLAGCDIIGDIHGHADKLIALLKKLGYTRRDGSFQHPQRTVLFTGDFIDRGPDNIAVLNLVRAMVDAGSARAVMGNHEYNALCYHSRHPETGEPLRPHTAKNNRQHRSFLDEFSGRPQLLAETLAWFRTLPLFLDLDGVRAVHAEWDGRLVQALERRGGMRSSFQLDDAFLLQSATPGTPEHVCAETLLKGSEIELPAGHGFHDKDGHYRREIRTRWWQSSAASYREIAMLPESQLAAIPELPLKSNGRNIYPREEKPVFFGHYWMEPPVRLLAPNAACVDFSVAKDGVLCAYRWDGEPTLDAARLVYV
ncbi:metallophosphoesterase [Geothermobacter hydrogeniphilus]|uniref:Calcineurin-like phosphoesterase domain-containing protein n=1 Tax=Geothermobacter hydrogeniphilus TaxID=1969733 RepID=A0A1X0Y5Q4_9BACT|nr:metallophosphoesterase [Geothermobacter hydrogeniphilus]ORJ60530.1 hypothetical protein B5V00_08180 [Geothermobacter hydrogeniphilus]